MSKATARKIASVMSNSGGRFLYPTYKGERWTTDGYMTAVGEYLPTRKSVEVESAEPKLDDIVPRYARKAKVTERKEVGDITRVTLTTKVTSAKLNAKYHDVVMEHYPTAKVKVADEPFTPVKYEVDKKLVALVMPLKG